MVTGTSWSLVVPLSRVSDVTPDLGICGLNLSLVNCLTLLKIWPTDCSMATLSHWWSQMWSQDSNEMDTQHKISSLALNSAKERNFSLPRSHGQQLRLKLQTGPALRRAAGTGVRALRYLRAGAQGAALPCPKTDGPVPKGPAAKLKEYSAIYNFEAVVLCCP